MATPTWITPLPGGRYGYFFNTLGHLGRKVPYGDVAVVITPEP